MRPCLKKKLQAGKQKKKKCTETTAVDGNYLRKTPCKLL